MTTQRELRARYGQRPFECDSCGSTPTCPMLVDETWHAIAPRPDQHVCVNGVWRECGSSHRGGSGLLCIRCAELKLGREITVDDLLDCVGNAATRVLVARAKVNP